LLRNDGTDKLDKFLLLVRGVEIGDFTGVKKGINIFQECLLFDLRISDQEDHLLSKTTSVFQERFDIVSPFWDAVSLRDFGLEGCHASHETGESSEGLSTRSADTDEQSVATR
jgi:hypothetical protein